METDDLVQATLSAWNRDDVDAWIETLQPDVTYHTSGIFPGLRPSYIGHEGIRVFWQAMHDPWEELRIDLERVEKLDEQSLVVEFRFRGTGAGSGAAVDLQFTNAARIRDGLVAEMFAGRTPEDALTGLRASRS